MRMRFLSIPLDDEFVEQWEIGFYVLSVQLAHAAAAYRLEGWPELVRAEQAVWGWLLVFAWPEQMEYVS